MSLVGIAFILFISVPAFTILAIALAALNNNDLDKSNGDKEHD